MPNPPLTTGRTHTQTHTDLDCVVWNVLVALGLRASALTCMFVENRQRRHCPDQAFTPGPRAEDHSRTEEFSKSPIICPCCLWRKRYCLNTVFFWFDSGCDNSRDLIPGHETLLMLCSCLCLNVCVCVWKALICSVSRYLCISTVINQHLALLSQEQPLKKKTLLCLSLMQFWSCSDFVHAFFWFCFYSWLKCSCLGCRIQSRVL